MKVIKVKIKGAGMGVNAYTSVVHGADLANPVRVGADGLQRHQRESRDP